MYYSRLKLMLNNPHKMALKWKEKKEKDLVQWMVEDLL